MNKRAQSKTIGKRMAKMVSPSTAELIRELAQLVADEQRRESRVSDNEVIRLAVVESIETRARRVP